VEVAYVCVNEVQVCVQSVQCMCSYGVWCNQSREVYDGKCSFVK